jgi:isoquinoline 1-oxidoreductase beta subunit
VGHSHTAYATEVFLDQLLEAGGKDPVQGRLDLLKGDMTRDRTMLEKVAVTTGEGSMPGHSPWQLAPIEMG